MGREVNQRGEEPAYRHSLKRALDTSRINAEIRTNLEYQWSCGKVAYPRGCRYEKMAS